MNSKFFLVAILLTAAPIASASAEEIRQPASADPARIAQSSKAGVTPLFRYRTIDAAWSATQRSRRPMFLYVTSNNCLYCKKMFKETLLLPEIAARVASGCEPFKFNASKDPKLAEQLGIRAFPTILVISPENKLLYKAVGFKPAEDFAAELWPILRESDAFRRLALTSAAGRIEAIAADSHSTGISGAAQQ